MCRLFGVIADAPVSLTNPILRGSRPFIELSHKHHDGWGIGFFGDDLSNSDDLSNGGAHIVKAPLAAYRDEEFTRFVGKVSSQLIIVHLRDAKYGEVAFRNTHPFYSNGWVFAHNGSVEGYRDLEIELDGVTLEGETDSERYFHILLQHIEQKGDAKEGLVSALQWLEINQFEGAKNFLMTDGDTLFAYRHGRDLFYTERVIDGMPQLEDGVSSILTATPARPSRMVMIASEVITDDVWHEVPEDCLITIDGQLRISCEPVMDKIIACC